MAFADFFMIASPPHPFTYNLCIFESKVHFRQIIYWIFSVIFKQSFNCILNSLAFNVAVKIVTSLNHRITFLLKCIFCTFALSGHFLYNIFISLIIFSTTFTYLCFMACSKTQVTKNYFRLIFNSSYIQKHQSYIALFVFAFLCCYCYIYCIYI